MTMHLAHPALSMMGKYKGKQKFRNAEEARKARELDSSWQDLQKKWAAGQEQKRQKNAFAQPTLSYKPALPPGRSTTKHIPSIDTGGCSTAPIHKVYTGDKIIGIGTMHKSNAVPIFSQDEAKEISRMRRG